MCTPRECPDLPEDADPGERCDRCPLTLLENAMQSQPGVLVQISAELDHVLEAKVAVAEDSIAADEFAVLKHLRAERERRREQLQERERKRQSREQ